jgi:hypothetical protein
MKEEFEEHGSYSPNNTEIANNDEYERRQIENVVNAKE